MRTLPTGTVTFLFSDVEGSTRLLTELGDRYEKALQQHRDRMREAFARHGGVEVDTQGDAFFCAFASAHDAVAAAEEAQRGLAGSAMRVRIGLHTGEPKLGREGYLGIDVHRAARICSAGHGGQVLLSQTTWDLLANEIDSELAVRDLGKNRLKDLAAPERLYQLLAPGLESEFPALKTVDNRPTNLPPQATPLIGREHELQEIQQALLREHVRLLTLTGAGGTGKTRLALQLAAQASDRFQAGVFAVFLAPFTDPALVLPALAHALKLREAPGQDLTDTLTEYLRDRELLALFDNFEHLLAAATDLSTLLATAPRLKLIVTSRAPLRIGGELEYALEPLLSIDARTLFIERARAVRGGFDPDAHSEAVGTICERLDCLPLALELAATRVRSLTPELLLERLDSALELLTSGARDAQERQQTLRATIEWSYRLLTTDDQAVFRSLAVFRGGWTLEAAEAVCDLHGDLETPVIDALDRLVENSLVRPGREVVDTPRFFILETIREYAAERLEEAGEGELARERHGEYFVTFAERAEPELIRADQRRWLVLLRAELPNLRAAMHSLLEREAAESAARVAAALFNFWDWEGHFSEGRSWLTRALAAGDLVDGVAAKALDAAAFLSLREGDFSSELGMAARDRAARADDAGTLARALATLAFRALFSGDAADPEELAREAVAVASRSTDRWALAQAYKVLAGALIESGRGREAVEAMEEALRLAEELGDIRYQLLFSCNLAEVTLVAGDPEGAREIARRTAVRAEDSADPYCTAHALNNLGCAELLAENPRLAEASASLRRALVMLVEFGDRRHSTTSLIGLAAVGAARGGQERARTLWRDVASIMEGMAGRLWTMERMVAERYLDSIERPEEGRDGGRSFEDAVALALEATGTGVEPTRQ
ncbi:MAG: adenylate/guanylate cyclase domain-containing protein [Actinobacteria bacterium]|nr:MAG: adenylate/guanylate cyclase domain-containing protein [Actinomycetota bacterium]